MTKPKPEEKKEDFFTRLGRTIVENFLKQWKIWSQKTRITFTLAFGILLITLINYMGTLDFKLFILGILQGIFTSLWLLGVMDDIKKLKIQPQPPKKKEKKK